ncbi:hypothetical protein DRQ25_08140 [Candidatus Fermentibacteria bacterium]|nr:MAG: hypothetical protein DRQ25_08140 [Candidatus Fermentibacteria bacterium]
MIESKIVRTDVEQHFFHGVPIEESGVLLKRMPDGTPITNVPWLVIDHSPTGFNWGYGGSGSADLALNILENALWTLGLASKAGTARPNNEDKYFSFDNEVFKCYNGRCMAAAWEYHQDFKWQFLTEEMPESGGFIPWSHIVAFIYDKMDLVVPEELQDLITDTVEAYLFIPAEPLTRYFDRVDFSNATNTSVALVDRQTSTSLFCSKIAEAVFGVIEDYRLYVYVDPDPVKTINIWSPKHGDELARIVERTAADLFDDGKSWTLLNWSEN